MGGSFSTYRGLGVPFCPTEAPSFLTQNIFINSKFFGTSKRPIIYVHSIVGEVSNWSRNLYLTMERKCLKCGLMLNLEMFYDRKLGKHGKDSYCKPCRKSWGKERRSLNPNFKQNLKKSATKLKARNTEFLNKIKLEKGCSICGYRENAIGLDFDHVLLKSGEISDLRERWSVERLEKEIHNCQILCGNCHREKTYNQLYANRFKTDTKKERNRDFIKAIKSNTPCKDCGKKFHFSSMDFDHVRGAKSGDIANMVGYRLERILEEIDKCDIVCSICHRLRTHFHK